MSKLKLVDDSNPSFFLFCLMCLRLFISNEFMPNYVGYDKHGSFMCYKQKPKFLKQIVCDSFHKEIKTFDFIATLYRYCFWLRDVT